MPWNFLMWSHDGSLLDHVYNGLFGAALGLLILWPLLYPRSRKISGIACLITMCLFLTPYLFQLFSNVLLAVLGHQLSNISFFNIGVVVFSGFFPGAWLGTMLIYVLRRWNKGNLWYEGLLSILALGSVALCVAITLLILFMVGRNEDFEWMIYPTLLANGLFALTLGIITIPLALTPKKSKKHKN